MRLILCLWFVFAAFICGLCQQPNIQLDKVEFKFFNKTYVRSPAADVSFEGKSILASAQVKIVQDFGTNVTAEVQVYELSGDEYKIFPLSMTVNFCDEIKKNTFSVKDLIEKYSDGPTSCPLKKGHYHLNNAVVDIPTPPIPLPGGSYKVIVKIHNGDDYVAEIHVFATIK